MLKQEHLPIPEHFLRLKSIKMENLTYITSFLPYHSHRLSHFLYLKLIASLNQLQ
jgi:hypothetical protein